GAVGRGVVGSVDLDRRPQAERGLDDEGNQMGLRIVTFAQLAVRVGPRRVEVSQCDPSYGISVAIPLEGALHDQLGFTIRIYGERGVVLGNGHDMGIAVNG